MFVTNGRSGNLYALVCKTDPEADPPHKGMSLFIAEKGPGITVSRDIDKIGYKGIDTVEVVFEDYRVPADNLLGGSEGHGMQHVLSGLEVGRINIASRAVGVARAAFEAGDPLRPAARDVRQADLRAPGDPAQARRHGDQDRGRAPAGTAGGAQEGQRRALRPRSRHGQAVRLRDLRRGRRSRRCASSAATATRKEFPVERFYRDAPLMIIGEGTNEIQRTVIARQLIKKYAI